LLNISIITNILTISFNKMEVTFKLIEDLMEMKVKSLPHYQIALVLRENNQGLTANQGEL
jgi:hypothetical protein